MVRLRRLDAPYSALLLLSSFAPWRLCVRLSSPPGADMRLAFSTNAYLNYSFTEAVTRLAGIGYAGVEIMADVPHAWPACLLEEQKQAIRDALKVNGLAVSNVNAFMMNAISDPRQRYWHPSWIEPDPHYRQI